MACTVAFAVNASTGKAANAPAASEQSHTTRRGAWTLEKLRPHHRHQFRQSETSRAGTLRTYAAGYWFKDDHRQASRGRTHPFPKCFPSPPLEQSIAF